MYCLTFLFLFLLNPCARLWRVRGFDILRIVNCRRKAAYRHGKGVNIVKSDYVNKDVISHILAALTAQNRLVLLVSLCSGLRVSDVLNLKTAELAERMTITEKKTRKRLKVRLDPALLAALRRQAGAVWVFEHRLDVNKHRTRQAVWKDLQRAAKAFRIPPAVRITPHTARKIYAVKQYRRTCSIDRVRRLLNHNDKCVTQLYALADVLSARQHADLDGYF